jgi:hypothetical protein
MATMSRSSPLASWDATKQQQYRQSHPNRAMTIHFVLDASWSMAGTPATDLRQAYNKYLAWLQHHADPMTLVELGVFTDTLRRSPLTPLGACLPLTEAMYSPRDGGTALYRAIGDTCTRPQGVGQHLLIVFTDGDDNRSAELEWRDVQVRTILDTLQDAEDWLCVFLGAMPGALAVGAQLGFHAGNCLAFSSEQIPDAFRRLTEATQRYLLAPIAERKLLAAGGIF